MSLKKRLIPALVGSALALGATSANAVKFTGVFVFGDSLSDAGFYRPTLLASNVPAPLVATLGRFTTNPGPVWSEIVAAYYGGNPNPSNAGGGIYAQGGSRLSAVSSSSPPNLQRPVTTQITEYLAASGGSANPNALYAVWAGANDLLQAGAAGVGAANEVAGQTARLRAAGARYIMVFGLPNLGLTPDGLAGGPAASGQFAAASAGFNITLFNALAATNQRVIPVDTFTLFTEVLQNAAAFGITNTTGTACGPLPPFTAGRNSQFCTGASLVPGATPTNYAFADGVHPTTGVHAIVADFAKSLIDGPNAYSTMAEVPLSTRAAHIRTLDEGLRSGQGAAVGKLTAFAAGDGGKFNIETNPLSPQTDSKNRSGTVGVTFRASDAMTFGVAIGKTTADATMGSLGKFKTDESAGSVFGAYKDGGFYGNFSASVANIKFNDIQRYIKLGQVMRTNTANTSGDNASANLTVGYDFAMGSLSIGPFIGMTMQSVSVGEFTENNANPLEQSSRLKISAQDRSSNVTSVGARASFALGKWTPFARVSFDQENKRDAREVTASPVTVTQGITYSIPGYQPNKKWGTSTIGIRGYITDQISLAVMYTSVFSSDNIKQDGVTANIGFAF